MSSRPDAATSRLPEFADFDPATLRGTPGFFRVGRTRQGQWWFLTPDNRPFFSKGVTSINRAGTMGGRYAKDGPYAAAVDARYGKNYTEPFVASVLQRLRDWNFNTMGAWVTPEFFDRGFPYTEIIEFTKSGAPQVPNPLQDGKHHRLPDVFSPQWPVAVDRLAAELATPRRESRDLIGYFTDNEISFLDPDDFHLWGQTNPELAGRRQHAALLQVCLANADHEPATQAAWAHVLAPHGGNCTALSHAWGIAFASRDDLRRLTREGVIFATPAFHYDNHVFVREFARRYFVTTSTAIRRHDPNHLILGMRFGSPPGRAVMESCIAPHVDVLSANNYRDDLHARLEIYARATNMPVLIGEFAWASGYFLERCYPEAPAEMPLVTRMHRMGRHTLEQAFPHPNLVGYTWYRWVQGDPANPKLSDHAMVLNNDAPHPHHPALAKLINARAEGIRVGQLAPYAQVTGGDPLES